MAKISSTKLSFKNNWFLFLILLVEGGSLMAVELIGAKLIAPFYGNSVYVWAAVLATTLGGLTIGYYAGGRLSLKHPTINNLLKIVAVSSVLVFLMPTVSGIVMTATLGIEDLRTGIVLSCVVFLTPILVTFGMVGPMTVRLMTTTVENVGKVAGTVYFTSTVGGIFTTFLFGFYLIPFIGLKTSSYIVGASLALLPIIAFLSPGIRKSQE